MKNTFREIVEAAKAPNAIVVSKVEYDKKDLERANSTPDAKKAKLMADKITDAEKLVKRTKAMIAVHGADSEIAKVFYDAMKTIGFSDEKIGALHNTIIPHVSIAVAELPNPVPRSGAEPQRRMTGRDSRSAIMNAASVYKGKLSSVIKEASKYGKTVILLGESFGDSEKGTPVAIIGSASGMSIDENGLDYYDVPKSGLLPFKIDTGMGYRDPRTEIKLTSYVLCENGNALTKYVDKSYKYYVFK